MKRTVVAVTLILVAAMVSGCIFSSNDDKDVKKGKVSGKITMTITGDPVANVTVMLINRNAKVDTVDYAANLKAFVDSTVTGANGEFVFEGIAPGNYAVAPVNEDTTKVYKFSYAADTNSSGFTVNGDAHTVNYIAENMGYPGAGWWPDIAFTVYVTDIFNGEQCQYLVDSIELYRRQWSDFVTRMVFVERAALWREYGRFFFRVYAPMGYSDCSQIVENYFEIRMKYRNYADMFGDFNTVRKERTLTISYPMNQPPLKSTWEYSITNDTFTCTGQ